MSIDAFGRATGPDLGNCDQGADAGESECSQPADQSRSAASGGPNTIGSGHLDALSLNLGDAGSPFGRLRSAEPVQAGVGRVRQRMPGSVGEIRIDEGEFGG